MYIVKADVTNSYFGNLVKDQPLDAHPQAADMFTCGYLRKMTEDELKEYEDGKNKETCLDVVKKPVKTKVTKKKVNTKVVDTRPSKKSKK